ncbi:MAG: ABC transporter ATP-binding protein [Bdellovibrionales bacterium]|nr:ABC transporter ATP-binding protein [Bdellovibrionales bacterium]
MSAKKSNLDRSFLDEEHIQHQLGFLSFMKRIWPLLWNHSYGFIILILVILSYVVTGRLMPVVFGHAIDEGIRKDDLSLVYQAACVYLVLEILRSTLHFAQTYGIQRLGNRVLYDLREKLISHVQSLPLTYFDKNPVGRTVTRVTNDIAALGELFSLGISAVIVSGIEMLAIVIAMSFISLKLALITTAVAPVLTLLCVHLSRKIRFVFRDAKRKLATINAFTAESLNGLKVLQLFHKTDDRQSEFNRYSEEFKKLNLKTVRLFALLWPIIELFNVIAMTTALFFGGLYREELGLSLGALTTFLLMVQSFFQPLKTILERYTQFQNGLASADRIFSLMDEPPEPLDGDSLPSERLSGKIQIRELSHRYSPKGPWALKDINLDIRQGESLALVGRTGSGKTTLISLLQRLYDHTGGSIIIEGRDLRSVSPREWRRRVGVVLQENFIFKGTIAGNISLNDPRISRNQVESAAFEAGCLKLLQTHKGGLDADVEERGNNLSVGERQLIAFARVLAFNPDILILDEATANIDSISEKLIQDATQRVISGRTSIIIAHRLSTILNCDRIAVLDHGQLLEIGSHLDLMNLKGKYFDLYTSQFKKKREPSCLSQI